VELIAIYLALVFGVAGISKLPDPIRVESVLRRQRIAPPRFVPALARALPVSEILVAAALLSGLWPAAVLGAAVALLTSFTVAEVTMIRRGRHATCGCYGAGFSQRLGLASVATLLLQLSLALAFLAFLIAGDAPSVGVIGTAAAACAAAVEVALLAQALALRRRIRYYHGVPGRWAPQVSVLDELPLLPASVARSPEPD
jgi:hypothetical protein